MTTRPFLFSALSRRTALLAAAVALLFAAPLPGATPEYISLAGLKAAGFQKFLDDARDQGYEPVYINGYDVGDHVEYAGVAIKDPEKRPFESKFDMTDDEYEAFFKEMRDKDFQLSCVSGYHTKEGPRFAAVWVSVKSIKSKTAGRARHNQTETEFDDTVKAMRKDGYTAMNATAYQGPDGADRYTASFWIPGKGVEWENRYNMTAAQYQDQVDKWQSNGFRLMKVHVYGSPDGLRFLASARLNEWDKKNIVWEEHHDLTGNQYQKQFDKLATDGFSPSCICGYRDGGKVKFAVIWIKGPWGK